MILKKMIDFDDFGRQFLGQVLGLGIRVWGLGFGRIKKFYRKKLFF